MAYRGLLGRNYAPRWAVTDFADGIIDAGGIPYGEKRLGQLERHLARRNVTLEVGSDALPAGKSGAFIADVDGTARLLLTANPTNERVWHELGHYIQWRRIGSDAYLDLPRVYGNNAPEQFVFDLLERPERWDRLTPGYRIHMVNYIELWGGVGR
jgi:hypothetical protein